MPVIILLGLSCLTTSQFLLSWLSLNICLPMVLCFLILFYIGLLLVLFNISPSHAFIFLTLLANFYMSPLKITFKRLSVFFCHVKGTFHFGLSFHRSADPATLIAYFNADWAGCPDIRRFTFSYSIFLGVNLVSWSAIKQPTASRSTCESEYRALTHTIVELLWLIHLLCDLRVSIPKPPLLLCDNKSEIVLSSNRVSISTPSMLHVELEYSNLFSLAKFTLDMCLLIFRLPTSSPKAFLSLELNFFTSSFTSIQIQHSACTRPYQQLPILIHWPLIIVIYLILGD